MSSVILRQAARAARTTSRSCAFATSSVVRKDLVQDLYIKELKAYKPAPAAKDAHVGAVKSYSLPPTPQPPTLPADIAAELTAYDASEPTKSEAKAGSSAAAHAEDVGAGAGAESFLEVLEAEPVSHGHH